MRYQLEDINNKSFGGKNPRATCDNHRRHRQSVVLDGLLFQRMRNNRVS